MQQRGVERELLECLLKYGEREYDHKGCEIVFLTDSCLDAIARYESHPLWIRMVAARSLYAVVDIKIRRRYSPPAAHSSR